MRVITGRVVGGKIEFETDLKEGTPVAILAAGDAGFQLTADEVEWLRWFKPTRQRLLMRYNCDFTAKRGRSAEPRSRRN